MHLLRLKHCRQLRCYTGLDANPLLPQLLAVHEPTSHKPSIHRELTGLGFLMADLVDWLFLTPASVESVGSVENQPRHVADIAIRMDNARRNPDCRRV